MNSNFFEAGARFVPNEKARRTAYWPRFVLVLLVLAGYLAIAGTQDGPIQVWLVGLAPLALVAVELALRITDDSESDE